MKCVVIMNHNLTSEQMEDLTKNWGVTEIEYLPSALQGRWASVPPEYSVDAINYYIDPIKDYAKKHADIVILAGEITACMLMLDFLRKLGIPVITATTKRAVIEKTDANGTVTKKTIFRHVRFRRLA